MLTTIRTQLGSVHIPGEIASAGTAVHKREARREGMVRGKDVLQE